MLPQVLLHVFISGLSSTDKKAYGKIGLRALSFYMLTTLIAAFTGIALACLIRPGRPARTTLVSSGGDPEVVQAADSFLDLIRFVAKSFFETEQDFFLSV